MKMKTAKEATNHTIKSINSVEQEILKKTEKVCSLIAITPEQDKEHVNELIESYEKGSQLGGSQFFLNLIKENPSHENQIIAVYISSIQLQLAKAELIKDLIESK